MVCFCRPKTTIPSEETVPATVLYELAKDHEHAPAFEEVVEVRFNSSHGRSAVQEVALDRGQPVIPLNNFEVVQFNSTHGHSSHSRPRNSRIGQKTFSSAHGRLQNHSAAPSPASTPRASEGNSIRSQEFSKSRSLGMVSPTDVSFLAV